MVLRLNDGNAGLGPGSVMARFATQRADSGDQTAKKEAKPAKKKAKRGFGLSLIRRGKAAGNNAPEDEDNEIIDDDDEDGETAGVKYTFGHKFRAWWEGVPPADLKTNNDADDADDEFIPARRAPPPLHPAEESADNVKTTKVVAHWNPTRIQAAELVWGKGNSGPGDQAYLLELVRILHLTSDMTVLNLGAGLGGAARFFSEQFGLWITAQEASPVLAEAAMERSVMAGMTKKVPVTTFDPAEPDLPEKKFDFVFSREALFRLENKRVWLDALAAASKATCQFVFTDLVTREPAEAGHGLIDAWKAVDPEVPHLWTLEQYKDYFANGMLATLHAPLDLTESFCSLIISGWWKAQRTMRRMKQSGDYDPLLLDALAEEAELWALCTAALQSGELAIYRFYGNKRG